MKVRLSSLPPITSSGSKAAGDLNACTTAVKKYISPGAGRQNCGHAPMAGEEAEEGRGGVITSPNYPGHYPNNTFCIWSIKVKHFYNFSHPLLGSNLSGQNRVRQFL